VEVQLYSPNRPVVDLSACFLWIMAIGTIVCASLWTEFVACEQVDERYNQLTRKDGPNSGTTNREDKEIFEISAKGAIVFILVASVFLLLLFYFMSSWFVWLLIVLFCIGGIEVFSHTFVMCIVLFLIGTILTLLSLLFSLNVEVYLFFFFFIFLC
jgi:signal peptide peptidase-like protein 2B